MSAQSELFDPEGALPLPPGAPDLSAAHLRPPDTPAQPRPPLVLAIDDSPAVRTIVEYILARAGLRVVTFPDGLEAIRALAEQRLAVPDLVLLDIGLPRLDGYEVAAVLRTNEAFARVPILMLSGRDGIVDRVRSRMVGAATFVAKPFRPQQLVALVCDHLGIAPADAIN